MVRLYGQCYMQTYQGNANNHEYYLERDFPKITLRIHLSDTDATNPNLLNNIFHIIDSW